MKQITLYPGDIYHDVTIKKNEPIRVEEIRSRIKLKSLSYVSGIMFDSSARPTAFQSNGLQRFFNAYPSPAQYSFRVLVHRPWYNHLRALVPFIR